MRNSFIGVISGLLLTYLLTSLTAGYYYPNYIGFELTFIVLSSQGFNAPILYLVSLGIGLGTTMILPALLKKKVNPTGFARWADHKTIKKAALDSKEGIVMGRFCSPKIGKGIKSPDPTEIPIKRHKEHLRMNRPLSVGVLAPAGTGKTTSLVIPTLFDAKHSFIVHDPKGEVFETTAPYRSTFSKILRVDPMGTGKTAVFNPFDKKTIPSNPNKIRGHIQNIAIKIIPDDKDGASFFVDNARKIFIFVAEWLVKVNGETSIPEVADKIFSTPDVAEEFQRMIDYICSKYGSEIENEQGHKTWHFEDPVANIIYKDGNGALATADAGDAWGSILGTLTPHLDKYANDLEIRRSMEGPNDINPMDFKDKSTTLYIVVPDEDREKLYPIVNLLMEFLATKLISIQPSEWRRINKKRSEEERVNRDQPMLVSFLIDEFPRLGKMDEIFNLPSISRGARVNVIFIAQSIGQIQTIYGEKNVITFKDNMEYWYVFRQNSVESSKAISEIIGHESNTRKSKSVNTKSLFSHETSQSVSDEKNVLVSDEFIRALPSDPEVEEITYAVVFRGGLSHRPFLVENLSWYKQEEYIAKNKDNEAMLGFLRG